MTAEAISEMAESDWYRRTTWSETDQADFFKRLKRTREPSYKAQHVLVQAETLAEQGDHLTWSAYELVCYLLDHHAMDIIMSSALNLKAQCLDSMGKVEEALEAFNRCIEYEEQGTKYRSTVWRDFGRFVIRRQRKEFYSKAVELVERQVNHLVFPVEKYYTCGILAVIAEEQGAIEKARIVAAEAIAYSNADTSGFSRHPKVGLVDRTDTDFHRRLLRLTGAR